MGIAPVEVILIEAKAAWAFRGVVVLRPGAHDTCIWARE